MKLIHFLLVMLAHLIIIALAALVSADDHTQPGDHLIPHGKPMTKEQKIRLFALIPVYVLVAAILLVFIPCFLWRIIRNWDSWKLHTGSPRPQYIRSSFRWVDLETWKQNQAKQARRKEAKRDQHPIYRTTKANYKWIFHDPTGQLQQRFNQQKERSHLRFLPSWMRSYPHGTIQSGIPAQQSKASKENYQLPKLHVNENSCLSNLESVGNRQFDGSPMSGALQDPYYQLPNLSKMDYHGAMTRNISGKACSLPNLPVMDDPVVVQVWFTNGYNAGPERTGSPPVESEEELRGEVESAEEAMQRDTERRLDRGRRYQAAIDVVAQTNPALLRPYEWPAPPNRTGLEVRSQPYVEYLESRISLIEERIRGVYINRIPRSTRRALDTDIQELERVTGVRRPETRPPVPLIECYAIELNQMIADLETRINDYLADEEDLPVHETLDSMRVKLRQAKLARDRLPPIHGLPPPVPSSRGRLQLHQIFRPPRTDAAAEPVPRPRVLPGVGIIVENPDARANTVANDDDNSMPEHRNGRNSRGIPAGYTTAWPLGNILIRDPFFLPPPSPPRHGEANQAVMEDLATDTNTHPGHVSEQGLDDPSRGHLVPPPPGPVSEEGGHRIIAEGTGTDRAEYPDPTEEEGGPSSSAATTRDHAGTAPDVLDDEALNEALYTDEY